MITTKKSCCHTGCEDCPFTPDEAEQVPLELLRAQIKTESNDETIEIYDGEIPEDME